MNPDQQTRLEIMQVLEKDFPDRLLEDLIEVARYVEGDASAADEESQDSAAKCPEEAACIPAPCTWSSLERIPDDVRAATDADGDVIRRVGLGNLLVWKFEDELYENTNVTNRFAPFAEVLP